MRDIKWKPQYIVLLKDILSFIHSEKKYTSTIKKNKQAKKTDRPKYGQSAKIDKKTGKNAILPKKFYVNIKISAEGSFNLCPRKKL